MPETHSQKTLRAILARRVLLERKARSWSQEVLGERADLSQVYISQVETEKVAASIDTVEKLAKAFECAPSELLDTGS